MENVEITGDTESDEEIVLDVEIDEAGYEAGAPCIFDISFQVRRGQLLGLIGPNGAGKSTTIKTLLGLLKNTKAKVSFNGVNKSYAYVPEQPVFYEDLTLWEHLDLAAAAYGLKYEQFQETAERLLKQFGMNHVRDDLPAGFSKGMKQKMMLMLGFWYSRMFILWTSLLSAWILGPLKISCDCWKRSGSAELVY